MNIDMTGYCGVCEAFVYDMADDNFCLRCWTPYCHDCYIYHNTHGVHQPDGTYVDDGEAHPIMGGYISEVE